MQLSPSQVVEQKLVLDESNRKLSLKVDWRRSNSSSIDLHIGEILIKTETDGIVSASSYTLKPRETVCLISSERLAVKPGFVAYVFLKNRLSQNGILALNTGILDGGYQGVISTTVTNYSDKCVELSKVTAENSSNSSVHKAFFRIVFHKVDLTREEKKAIQVKSTPQDYEEYKLYRMKDLEKNPKYFLDPTDITTEINEKFVENMNEINVKKYGRFLTKVGLIFTALFVILPPLGEVFNKALFAPNYDTVKRISTLEEQIEILDNRIYQQLLNQRKQRESLTAKEKRFIHESNISIDQISEKLLDLEKLIKNTESVEQTKIRKNLEKLEAQFIQFRNNWREKTYIMLNDVKHIEKANEMLIDSVNIKINENRKIIEEISKKQLE